MSKDVYFVLGPEGSGTKLVTELIIRQTGAFGAPDHDQGLLDNYIDGDEEVFEEIDSHEHIVFRRSYPHGGAVPKIQAIVKALKKLGNVTVVVTVRSWPTLVQSQIHLNQHADTPAGAVDNIKTAYREIFYWIRRLKLNYTMVSFAELLKNKTATLHYMFSELGHMYEGNQELENIIDTSVENKRVVEYRKRTGV
jgi:hypothetical protein